MTQQQHTGFDAKNFQGQTSIHITKHETNHDRATLQNDTSFFTIEIVIMTTNHVRIPENETKNSPRIFGHKAFALCIRQLRGHHPSS